MTFSSGNHADNHRPNWAPRSPITIINIIKRIKTAVKEALKVVGKLLHWFCKRAYDVDHSLLFNIATLHDLLKENWRHFVIKSEIKPKQVEACSQMFHCLSSWLYSHRVRVLIGSLDYQDRLLFVRVYWFWF